ncbi:MAG: DUF99 family protein [Candidatus Diapherotrites archaeon]|nr:DUF99 family protein [Candidatus Diapherotrites archaeon]
MKALGRVAAFDDGFFTRKQKKVLLIGVVARFDSKVEGILSTEITKDGLDSTAEIISVVKKSKFNGIINLILLQGINFAGFNIVDLEKLNRELAIPSIAVFRRMPRMNLIKRALKNFADCRKRIRLIEKAGEIHTSENFYFQCKGIPPKEAEKLLKKLSIHSNWPEPLRLAHLIASGVTIGQSTKPRK